jgi:hypothetical protein
MTVQDGDIIRVAARMTIQGRGDVVNVYHIRYDLTGPINDNVAGDAAVEYMEALYTVIRPAIVNEQTFEDISLFNVTQGVPIGVFPWATLVAGGDTSQDALPSQVAALVRLTTGYSRNWARKFLGTFTDLFNDASGHVSSTLLGYLASYATLLIAPHTYTVDVSLAPVVYNTQLSSYVGLTAAVIKNVWSTIRTRREGRGS